MYNLEKAAIANAMLCSQYVDKPRKIKCGDFYVHFNTDGLSIDNTREIKWCQITPRDISNIAHYLFCIDGCCLLIGFDAESLFKNCGSWRCYKKEVWTVNGLGRYMVTLRDSIHVATGYDSVSAKILSVGYDIFRAIYDPDGIYMKMRYASVSDSGYVDLHASCARGSVRIVTPASISDDELISYLQRPHDYKAISDAIRNRQYDRIVCSLESINPAILNLLERELSKGKE